MRNHNIRTKSSIVGTGINLSSVRMIIRGIIIATLSIMLLFVLKRFSMRTNTAVLISCFSAMLTGLLARLDPPLFMKEGLPLKKS